jgi:hypothetical protein
MFFSNDSPTVGAPKNYSIRTCIQAASHNNESIETKQTKVMQLSRGQTQTGPYNPRQVKFLNGESPCAFLAIRFNRHGSARRPFSRKKAGNDRSGAPANMSAIQPVSHCPDQNNVLPGVPVILSHNLLTYLKYIAN